MSLESLVRSYLRHGWSIVPVHVPVADSCTCGRRCDTPGKHPRGPWREYQQRHPKASEVRDWLESYDPCNIGIVTGRISGLVVVDVDMPKPDDIIQEIGLPFPTLTAVTGGGGRHYFYTCDKRVKSISGWDDGVDIRAEGGFVVAAPSLHESGNRYKWAVKVPPEAFPEELLTGRIVENSETRQSESGWYRELLEGVSEGTRSYAAARLAGRYATKGLDQLECLMLMSVWNDLNEPPLSESELKQTIRWIYKKHAEEDGDMRISRDAVAAWAKEK